MTAGDSSFVNRQQHGRHHLGQQLPGNHHHSLTSATDTFSDTQGGLLDGSLENITDDETLTSVRRIVDRTGSSANRSPQHQYQQLQLHLQTQASSRSHQPASYDSGTSSWRAGRKGSSHAPSGAADNGSGGGSIAGTGRERPGRNRQLPRGGGPGLWMDEEKSDKVMGATAAGAGAVLTTASSSDYDTDGDISNKSKGSRQMLEGPSHSQATDVNEFFTSSRFSQSIANSHHHTKNGSSGNYHNHSGNNLIQNQNYSNRKMDDDDRTFDYGDRDDDSNGSTSYAARRRKDTERRARLAAESSLGGDQSVLTSQDIANGGVGPSSGGNGTAVGAKPGESPLLNPDDVEHFTKSIDTPAVRLGAGVVGIASLGCLAFGPVGLLVGVAAVGLGFGVMQIPEEERTRIQAKAEKAVHNLQEKAADASESFSSSCLTTYKDSGVADHLPHCLTGTEGGAKDLDSVRSEHFCHAGGTPDAASVVKRNHYPANPAAAAAAGPQLEQAAPVALPHHHNDRSRSKKVACLRNARILPISQIHGLDPSAQPKAWLDVVASANTSNEQKNEAMEEILLLAKDKRRAKILLHEGILDFIVWTLSRYFEKLDASGKPMDWANPTITASEKTAANLAALCCVTLGKAHCAAIHTEGDLLLMSMYERGTVPEERQVAQMLHEVPHHARVTKTNDPTIVDPSKEVFALRQLTLPQAEELARSIKAVAEGRL